MQPPGKQQGMTYPYEQSACRLCLLTVFAMGASCSSHVSQSSPRPQGCWAVMGTKHGLTPASDCLQAVNAIGASHWSPASVVSTPGAGPSQLQPPRKVSSTQTSITLAWDSPQADEAGAVTSYILERDQGGDGDFQPAYIGPEMTCTVQGVQAGVIHHFRVQAENKVRIVARC